MNNYEIDLRKKSGQRDCLLVIACAKDQAAIVLAKSVFHMNRKWTERVVVWRGDEVIFEESKRVRLN